MSGGDFSSPGAQGKHVGTLARGTALSRVLGLIRDMLVAALLGPAADALLVAFRVPHVFRRLLAEGSVGMIYTAEESRFVASGDAAAHDAAAHDVAAHDVAAHDVAAHDSSEHKAARAAFAWAFARRLALWSLPCVAVAALLAGPLATLLSPGTEAIAERAANLLRLCLLYVPCSLFAAVAFAYAAGGGNFTPQALAPAMLNVALIACALLALVYTNSVHGAEYFLCAGMVIGGLWQALAGARAMRGAACAPYSFACSLGRALAERAARQAVSRRMLLRFPATVAGASPHLVLSLVGMALASFVTSDGGVSALYFAERLIELPLAFAGAAVGMAALPGIAQSFAERRHEEFSTSLSLSLSLSFFLSLPAAAGLFSLAGPLAAALFGHGEYDARAVSLTAGVLRGAAFGLPALCATRPLLGALFCASPGFPALVTAFTGAALLCLAGSIGFWLAGGEAYASCVALGVAMSLAAWGTLAHLALAFARSLPGEAKTALAAKAAATLRRVFFYAISAIVLGAALVWLDDAANGLGTFLVCLLALCTAALWIGGFAFFRNADARVVLASLRGR